MLGTPEVTEAVAEFLETLTCPVVVDPVMVAKSGDRLLHADAISALRDVLIPKATVITPNLPEAADLLDVSEAVDRDMMLSQARGLLALGPQAVLLKGGHLSTEESPDLLMSESHAQWFDTVRVVTTNTHGTGCTLSSALSSYLGQGHPVDVAVSKAKEYIGGAIAAADQLHVGEGHGPVNHFWALWGDNG